MSDLIHTIYMEAFNDSVLSGEHRNTEEFLYIPVYSRYDRIYPIVHLYAMKEKTK